MADKPIPDRHTVACDGCNLIQFESAFCRRCFKPLPDPQDVPAKVKVIRCCWSEGETLPSVAQVERMVIEEALRRAEGNVVAAAALIGIGKTTIYRKMKRYEGETL